MRWSADGHRPRLQTRGKGGGSWCYLVITVRLDHSSWPIVTCMGAVEATQRHCHGVARQCVPIGFEGLKLRPSVAPHPPARQAPMEMRNAKQELQAQAFALQDERWRACGDGQPALAPDSCCASWHSGIRRSSPARPNFVLYADLSQRVMQVLAAHSLGIKVYSVDEVFLDVCCLPETRAWAVALRATGGRWCGVPLSIGLAPTRTLAS